MQKSSNNTDNTDRLAVFSWMTAHLSFKFTLYFVTSVWMWSDTSVHIVDLINNKTIVERSIEWNKNPVFKIINRIHYLEIGRIQRLLIGVISILNRVLQNTLLCNTHIYKIRFQFRVLWQNNSHGFVTWCRSKRSISQTHFRQQQS